MGTKALDKGINREVEESSLSIELQEEPCFDDVYNQLLQKFSENMQQAFAAWVVLYGENDLARLQEIFERTFEAVRRYGEFFVVSFFICGTRWDELHMNQFRQIFELMDSAYDKKLGVSEDPEVVVSARHAAGRKGAKLMTLFLHYNIQDSNHVKFLKHVLLERGEDAAESVCFLLKRHDFSWEFFDEAVNLIVLNRLELAHYFLDACHKWSLTLPEAVRLSSNLIYLLKEKKGNEKCFLLLGNPAKPSFFRNDSKFYH